MPSVVGPSSGRAEPMKTTDLRLVLRQLRAANSLGDVAKGFQDSVRDDNTLADNLAAVAGVASGGAGYLGLAKNAAYAKDVLSPAGTFLAAGMPLVQDFVIESIDLGDLFYRSHTGGDPDLMRDDQDEINTLAHKARWDVVDAELTLGLGEWGEFGTLATTQVQSTGFQSASLLKTIYEVASNDGDKNCGS